MTYSSKILPPEIDPGEVLASIRRQIDTNGWFPIHTPARTGRPQYSHSVGFLQSLNAPDILVMAVPGELAEGIMFMAHEGLKSGHLSLPDDGCFLRGILEQPVLVKTVPERLSERIALSHRAIYPGQPVRMTQLMVPDVNGKFPGDQGCDPAFETLQDVTRLA
jgi:hypothetical protein